MIPLQEVNFHLNADRVIFAQLVKIGTNEFTATVSETYQLSNLPPTRYFMWLPTPSNSDAAAAFNEVMKYSLRNPTDRLLKVNNPCNCELLPVTLQQSIVGSDIQVSVNEPV